MCFIDGDQVHALGDFPGLMDALDRSHTEDTEALDDLMLSETRSAPSATSRPV